MENRSAERGPFASDRDYAECRELHRAHGTTYYLASQLFPADVRQRVHAVYGFVRLPDEWVDNSSLPVEQVREKLTDYRAQFLAGMEGTIPKFGVLRAFCDVAIESQMSVEEPILFLRAMERDLDIDRYETYSDLQRYMRGSASAVGAMMCSVFGVSGNEAAVASALKMGEAMQLTNFLRDIGEDWHRGRIYMPMEELDRFDLKESDIADGVVSDNWKRFMEFQIRRTRDLYAEADAGISALPNYAQRPVRLARTLYSQILTKIEELEYDVFSSRAHTTKVEKLAAVAKIMSGASRG